MTTDRLRWFAELGFPGFIVGLIGGVVAGALVALVNQPTAVVLTVAVAFGLSLAVLGGGYSLLVARGIARPGTFAPAALYWLVAFPLARLIQEVSTQLAVTGEPGLPPNVLGFLAYQGIVSAGFAVGFIWLHERIAPQWLHRIAGHNARAAEIFERYAAHAEHLVAVKEARKQAKASRRKQQAKA